MKLKRIMATAITTIIAFSLMACGWSSSSSSTSAKGVTAQMRSNKDNKYTFIMNFTEEEKKVNLGKE